MKYKNKLILLNIVKSNSIIILIQNNYIKNIKKRH